MHDTKPQLFIMDERLGDPIQLAEIEEIPGPTPDKSTICRLFHIGERRLKFLLK